ncbi:MAG TPA: UDP-glucose/GDP-mannose dehydrogenase family protein [Actinophytocola sp.]|uniref:UDP-glucose dehydrogenase family protein n=1 Tax=Actinophytocola sp. TaxID=1872138 RepID=UPI002DDDAF3F|nr:UDP-glucose/GDP-mannose dehydrogenase family protein [Actinophytocola sp.]HEV2778221.1 UDP-glucose/GDP-mannose dehydrogenase family protein [Actinophytocola sp.]
MLDAAGDRAILTVIGTGYLGTTHAVCMAELGFRVLGVDIDAEKIARLSAGQLWMYEPDLEQRLRRNVANGRLEFTTSYDAAAELGDVHFLCVGTPQQAGGHAADLSAVDGAIEALAPRLRRSCLVVGKSTVPVGTADRLARRVAALAPVGEDAELAWNPEFLREGFAVEDTLCPDRLVAGVRSERAEKTLREIYAPLIADGVPFLVTDYQTAELVKIAANSFLATKISFINAMSEVCEAANADVELLAAALALDGRIGAAYLGPGIGFGGSCLPKDIRAFLARAEELGVGRAVTFLREVDAINTRQRARLVAVARTVLGGSLRGRAVGVLGAAFKPNSDDVRDSPALAVAAAIHAQGGRVTVYDPIALDNARAAHPELGYRDTVDDAARGADALLLLTEWPQFGALDPEPLGEVVARRNVIDGRNALDPERWRAAGWRYSALGRTCTDAR